MKSVCGSGFVFVDGWALEFWAPNGSGVREGMGRYPALIWGC